MKNIKETAKSKYQHRLVSGEPAYTTEKENQNPRSSYNKTHPKEDCIVTRGIVPNEYEHPVTDTQSTLRVVVAREENSRALRVQENNEKPNPKISFRENFESGQRILNFMTFQNSRFWVFLNVFLRNMKEAVRKNEDCSLFQEVTNFIEFLQVSTNEISILGKEREFAHINKRLQTLRIQIQRTGTEENDDCSVYSSLDQKTWQRIESESYQEIENMVFTIFFDCLCNQEAQWKPRNDGLEEDEDYLSDFSDEDFTVEKEEEQSSMVSVRKLKERLEDPEASEALSKALSRIKGNEIENFSGLLEEIDVYLDAFEIESLLNVLNIEEFTVEKLKAQFLLIKDKPLSFWRNKICKEDFENLYSSFNFNKFNKLANPRRAGTLEIISQKINAFCHNKIVFTEKGDVEDHLKLMLEELKQIKIFSGYLNKSLFRKLMIKMQLPLNRKEQMILYKILDRSRKGKISFADIKSVLLSPNLVKSMSQSQPQYKRDLFYEKKTFLETELIIDKILQYITLVPQWLMEIKDLLRENDRLRTNLISYIDWMAIMKRSGLPLQETDIEKLFKFIACKGKEGVVINKERENIEYTQFLTIIEESILNGNARLEFPSSRNSTFRTGSGTGTFENNSTRVSTTFYTNTFEGTEFSDKYNKEKTMKMKIDKLEFENNKLKANLKTEKEVAAEWEQRCISLQSEINEMNNNFGLEMKHLKEKEIDFVRKNFLEKEMEMREEIQFLIRKNQKEVEIIGNKHKLEVEGLHKELARREVEIDNYRKELDSILEEFDKIRKSQRALTARE